MATPNGKDVYHCYFATSADNPNLHKCRESLREIKQNIRKGYVNLLFRVTSQHKEDYMERLRTFARDIIGGLDNFARKVSTDANDIYGWIDWITMENLAPRSCEKNGLI